MDFKDNCIENAKVDVRLTSVLWRSMAYPTTDNTALLTQIARRQEALILATLNTAKIASITNTEVVKLVEWLKEASDKPPLIDVVLELFDMVREVKETQEQILAKLG